MLHISSNSMNSIYVLYLKHIWSISPRMYSPLWNCRGLHFFYYTLSFGDDLICVQIWMGMVSFLSSPVGGTFWWKKWKDLIQKGAYFNVFFDMQSPPCLLAPRESLARFACPEIWGPLWAIPVHWIVSTLQIGMMRVPIFAKFQGVVFSVCPKKG